jgi:hypothetical protein
MGLFQDDDGMNFSWLIHNVATWKLTFWVLGSAYLLFASDNNVNFKIANLSSDYLSVSSLVHEFPSKYLLLFYIM